VGIGAVEMFFSSLDFNASVIRTLKILRLMRVVRVVRVMRFFTELRVMALGIVGSMGSLMWAIVILLTFVFIFAVVITQMVTFDLDANTSVAVQSLSVEDDTILREAFGSVGLSSFTLFLVITNGIDWESIASPLIDISFAMFAGLCFYIVFSTWAVLNVVTGVFVENAIKSKESDRDLMFLEKSKQRERYVSQIRDIFERFDANHTGVLEYDEFIRCLQDPYAQECMAQLGLEVGATSDTESLWKALDFDGNGSINVDEFIFGCTRFKGSARSLDLARVMHVQQAQSESIETIMTDLASFKEIVDFACGPKAISNQNRNVTFSGFSAIPTSRVVNQQEEFSNAEFEAFVVAMETVREDGD
jgi:hypothetical protein